jgi:hypothetical protein
MKIQRSADQLVVRDSAGCFWLFGLFFVCIGGLFVLGPLGLFTNRDQVPLWVNLLSIVLGLMGIGAGIYVWRGAPFTTIVFDRRRAQVQIERRWLFIRSMTQYAWQDISEIHLREDKDSDGDPIYRIEIVLHSGECVPLSQLWLFIKSEQEAALDAIHAFGVGQPKEPGFSLD